MIRHDGKVFLKLRSNPRKVRERMAFIIKKKRYKFQVRLVVVVVVVPWWW